MSYLTKYEVLLTALAIREKISKFKLFKGLKYNGKEMQYMPTGYPWSL